MRKVILHIAFAFIILLMVLPGIQLRFSIFQEKPLKGAFKLAEEPQFNKMNWKSGEFQENAERYLKDHSGFRNFLVRVQNQIDFSLFRQANAEGVVVGKNKQLYEYDYIRSWLGIDYPGDSFVEKKLQRTKYVQEYLKREKGIDLVVVFEPGKASYYPEDIPSTYSDKKTGPSTYDRYRQKASELDIDVIDFQKYFLKLKPGIEYPLFPCYGTHWSEYGMHIVTDSLLRLIEDRRKITLTKVSENSFETSTTPRSTDDDVLKTMNLLFPLKGEKLAYPSYSFDTAHPGDKPMVLVVADSYYFNIFNTSIPKYIFANEAFWFYNTVVYPDHYSKPTFTKDLDLRREVEKQDVIFLMVTERFIYKFDWAFIDELYALYTPSWLQDPVYDNINGIMSTPEWYADMINKAEKEHTTLEDILYRNGLYLFSLKDTVDYFINYGPQHFSRSISRDPHWMVNIHEQAVQKGISDDEMLQEAALFTFKQDYPGLYQLNRGLEAEESSIYADPGLLDSLKAEAAMYRCDPASLIRIKAWQLYEAEEIQRTCKYILDDPVWLEHVREKAIKKRIPLEEMVRLDAEYMWKQRLKKF
jgi:hypothetical protein